MNQQEILEAVGKWALENPELAELAKNDPAVKAQLAGKVMQHYGRTGCSDEEKWKVFLREAEALRQRLNLPAPEEREALACHERMHQRSVEADFDATLDLLDSIGQRRTNMRRVQGLPAISHDELDIREAQQVYDPQTQQTVDPEVLRERALQNAELEKVNASRMEPQPKYQWGAPGPVGSPLRKAHGQ